MDYIEEYKIAGHTYGIADQKKQESCLEPYKASQRYTVWYIGCRITPGCPDIIEARSFLKAYAAECIRGALEKLEKEKTELALALSDLLTDNLESLLVVKEKEKRPIKRS